MQTLRPGFGRLPRAILSSACKGRHVGCSVASSTDVVSEKRSSVNCHLCFCFVFERDHE